MGDSVKGFTKVQADNIHSLSLTYYMGHPVIGGDQVGRAGPAFHEAMLAGPDPLVVLHLPSELTQDEPLNNFPQYLGQGERPVVPRILLQDCLVDGLHMGKPPVIWDLPC